MLPVFTYVWSVLIFLLDLGMRTVFNASAVFRAANVEF